MRRPRRTGTTPLARNRAIVFFENIGNKSSSVKCHFRSHLSPSLGAATNSAGVSMKPPSIYVIEKDIVEVIIGDMYYSTPQVLLQQQGTNIDDDGIDEDNDTTSMDDNCSSIGAEEEVVTSHQQQNIPTFASAAEREAVHANRRANAMQTKQRALSLIEKQKVISLNHNEEQRGENNNPGRTCPHDENKDSLYQYVVTIPSTKKLLFLDLVIWYISCGVSFCMTRNIIEHTAEVFAGPRITCSHGDISKLARVACALNLQRISGLLKSSRAFSIALDSATHQSTSYLDLRFRIYGKRNREINNLHGCALPIHDRHTGKVIHDMLSKFLSVLCPDWKISMLGVASDGARAAGVVTRLQRSMHEQCPMLRIWCGAHQLDLVMEHIMTKVVNDRFFAVMLKFITHLSRQQKLIAEMRTTCPCIVNCWLSSYKVTNSFKLHRPELLNYIHSSNPMSAPPQIWWVYLLAMDAFTNSTAITFQYIQGSTTLVSQQNAAFERLVATFIEDVCIKGPLTNEGMAVLNPATYVSSGSYAVLKVCIREYLVGLASWVGRIIEEADASVEDQLLNDVGRMYMTACDRISKICVLRREDNQPFIDKHALPPFLSHELVKTRPGDFLRQVCAFKFRLEHRYSDVHVDLIADEHRAPLIMHYDDILRQGIDSLNGSSSFVNAWSVLGKESFPNLTEFCGVVATLFPGTSTVESDFSVLHWEKDDFRKSLSDFGLEAVLQLKQHLMIQQIK